MVARVRCRFSGYGAIANRQTNASASSFFARGTHLAPPRAHGKRNVTSNHPRGGVWGVGLWEMGEIGKYADTAPPALNARTRAAAARSRLRKRKIRENLSLPPTRPLALPKGENFAGLPSPPTPLPTHLPLPRDAGAQITWPPRIAFLFSVRARAGSATQMRIRARARVSMCITLGITAHQQCGVTAHPFAQPRLLISSAYRAYLSACIRYLPSDVKRLANPRD